MRQLRLISSTETAAMKEANESERHLVELGERFLAHAIAIAVGFALVIVGLGMGVTMVMLPIGLPLGLFGLVLLTWGLFNRAPKPASSSGAGATHRL
jgi:hypothetical protein